MISADPLRPIDPDPLFEPAFLITIDTECDNAWARPRKITTRNLAFLPRFQALCERYGFKPTYLTNWEASNDEAFRRFAIYCTDRGEAEVGLHLHAWNSPPIEPLTAADFHHQPYLTDYPTEALRAKLNFLVAHLESAFGRKISSHRGGRWAFNQAYAEALSDAGLLVDCSVTPHVSWRGHPGAPDGDGGPDHSACPEAPFFVNFYDDGARRTLLELPMTILKRRRSPPERALRRALGKQPDQILWMRPDGHNRAHLLSIVDLCAREKRPYLQFTLHSSEFMPDGSPTFRTEQDIERLYEDLDAVFAAIVGRFRGETMTEFARRMI